MADSKGSIGEMYNAKDFVTNSRLKQSDLSFFTDKNGTSWFFDINLMLEAVTKINLHLTKQFLWHQEQEKLGMISILKNIPIKNISGGVGESLGECYCRLTDGKVRKNPHESGSPDFIPYTEVSKAWFDEPNNKSFEEGGFESKGSKMTNKRFTTVKPSSHHTQTSSPVTVAWDFFYGIPLVLGVFYTCNLNENDWKIGSIPQENDSKLTSSARLLNSGIEKIRSGWLILHRGISLPQKDKRAIYGLDIYEQDWVGKKYPWPTFKEMTQIAISRDF